MWGMAAGDVPSIFRALLGDIGEIVTLMDRSHQGALNHILGYKAMKGAFANDPNFIFNGTSVVDTTRAFWHGISQGRLESGRGARVCWPPLCSRSPTCVCVRMRRRHHRQRRRRGLAGRPPCPLWRWR